MKTVQCSNPIFFFFNRNRLFVSFNCLLCLCISFFAKAQETVVADNLVQTDSIAIDSFEFSIFDKMYQDTILNLALETDVQLFLNNKSKDIFQPAFISFTDKDSVGHRMPLKIKARGKSRKVFCDFPPVKLKFSKKTLKDNSLQEHNDIKLVTHCKDEMAFRQVVLKEYLVYKALNILSESSFKVQLVKMDYIDTEGNNKNIEQYGLLIEDENQLADRLEGKILDQRGLKAEYIASEQLTFIAMFQYMIGNTDWIIEKHHNLKFIKQKDASYLKLVPYDFDICGLVDAAYAIPKIDLPISNVRERLFLGKCVTDEEYENCLNIFRTHKDEIFHLFENFETLSKSNRRSMLKYLREFYEDIEQTSFLENKIRKYCTE